ncbi:MAG: alanine racemase [Eubacteriales bacterium]
MSHIYMQINTNTLNENLLKIKGVVQEEVKIMAVVKSDAYGHGSIPIANSLIDDVDYFGVGFLSEAIELREAGIETPILVMGPTYDFESIVEYNITLTIISIEQYKQMLDWTKEQKKVISFHLKVDTGMHRFGINLDELEEFMILYDSTFTKMEGIYSHFATTYKTNKKAVMKQKNLFDKFVRYFKENNMELIYHIANSENAIDFEEARYDMVRIGNGLYGSSNSKKRIGLKKIAKLKVKVVSLKEVKKGERIGYGLNYKAKKDITIAVIPFGFYDGCGLVKKPLGVNFTSVIKYYMKEIFRFLFRNRTIFYYNEIELPFIGKPTMQYTLVKVKNNEINIGDEIEVRVSPIFINKSIPRIYNGGL